MVTETAQYSALHCFLNFKQNNEYLLISNTLRFICSILLALAFYFILHLARHTFATMILSKGVPIESVSKMLGHTNIRTTQVYARITNKKIEEDMLALAGKLDNFNDSINQIKK